MKNKLLIFENTGILLFKKYFGDEDEGAQDDLESGFFSAIFHYFSEKFGEIRTMKTENSLILIKKVKKIYVTLIVSFFRNSDHGNNANSEKVWLLNKRLEENSLNLISMICRKIKLQINRAKWRKKEFFYNSMMIDEIKDDIEDIIKQWQYKINVMEKILDQKPPTLKKMKKLKKLNKNIPS